MSQVFTARQLCERALRVINAFPVTDSAADPEHLREAMFWLDLLLSELAATEELLFLVPSPNQVEFTLTNGTGAYDLIGALGANAPVDGIQFPKAAYLQWPSGHRTPLEIVTRDDFMAVRKPEESGPPRLVYIDRLPDSQFYVWPIPATTDTNSYIVIFDVQTYAPNVSPAGVTGAQPKAADITKFRQGWQRYLIWQLAHDLGSGPIFKRPETDLNRYGKSAAAARAGLLAHENREHDSEPPICEPFDDACGSALEYPSFQRFGYY